MRDNCQRWEIFSAKGFPLRGVLVAGRESRHVSTVTSGTEFKQMVRRLEGLGFNVLSMPDHLGSVAPLPALAAAADATTTMRLGTYVLNSSFYNPALLARDAAEVNLLSDGRLELGLGAGYVREEFDAAGLPFAGGPTRIEHLERVTTYLKEHLPQVPVMVAWLLSGQDPDEAVATYSEQGQPGVTPQPHAAGGLEELRGLVGVLQCRHAVAEVAFDRIAAVQRRRRRELVHRHQRLPAHLGGVGHRGAQQCSLFERDGLPALCGGLQRFRGGQEQQPRGVQSRLGLCEGVLRARGFRDGAARGGFLAGRQLDHFVDRALRDADDDRRTSGEDQRRKEAPVELPVDPGRGVQRRRRQIRWDEGVFDKHVIAAGAAHPADVPCVVDLQLIPAYRAQPDIGRTGLRDARLAVLRHDTDRDEPVRSVDAADDLPVSRQPVTTVDWYGGTGHARVGQRGFGTVTPDLGRARLAEQGAHEAVVCIPHQQPDRGVDAAEVLVYP